MLSDLADWREHSENSGNEDLIFPNPDGSPTTKIDYQNWVRRIWKQCADEATTPYDARHGHASLLYRAGWDAPRIAYRLGHSVSMLNDTYAHHFRQFDEDEQVDPLALIARARGENAPPAADGPTEDELARRIASLTDAQRAQVLALVDEIQWDGAVAAP